MADSKITALTAISTVDPTADPLVIVDVSDTSMAASGTTKKSTINQLLGAGGTATLASATITGNLTVDTNTLFVDSANDRVGIGLAAGINAKLHVSSTGSVHINQRTGGNGCFTQYVDPVSSNYVGTDSGNFRVANNSAQDLLNIQQLGVFSFGDGLGGTRMTLNATGLGVGGSPTAKISCAGYSSANQLPDINIARSSSGTAIQTGPNIVFADGTSNNTVTLQNSQGRFGIWNYGAGAWNERFSVDSSGNIGIGVVPSGKLEVQESGTGSGLGGIVSSTASSGGNAGYVFRTGGTNRWSLSITGSAGAESIRFYDVNNSATRLTIDSSGNVISNVTGTAPTLATNSQMVFNLTSNTNLRISVRGTDGVTRTANITLA